MSIVRRLVVFAVIPLAGTVMLGCGSSVSGAPTTTTSPTTPPRPTVPATTSVPATPATTTPTRTTAVAGGPCTSAQLTVTTGGSQGAAGTEILQLVFTNTSPTMCTLQGFPGVSAVIANGVQLGVPAARAPSASTPLVALEPGQTTQATFTFTDPTVVCSDPTIAVGLRVYPPGQTAALFTPTTGVAQCPDATTTNFLIYPIGGSFGS